MFGIEKRVVYKAYSMAGRMIVLRIFVFCCSDASLCSEVVVYYLVFAKVIPFCMAHFRDGTNCIPRDMCGSFCERTRNCCYLLLIFWASRYVISARDCNLFVGASYDRTFVYA